VDALKTISGERMSPRLQIYDERHHPRECNHPSPWPRRSRLDWGRPVGLTVAKDGSLLVSEDGNNTIWRITYKK
jgi:hypothetical protein